MPEKRGVTLHAIRAAAVLLLSVFVTTCEPQKLGGPGPVEPGVDGAGTPAVAVEARVIEPLDFGMTNPAGLAFSPTAGLFFVLPRGIEAAESETELGMITLAPDPAGTVRLGVEVADPVNLAFDALANRLVLLDTERQELVAMPASPDGRLNPERMVRLELGHAGLAAPQGLTVDPASGRLFVLDAAGPRIVRFEPDAGPFLSEIDLAPLGAATLRGIAFDPTTRHLHVLDPQALVLYELTEAGAVVATRDLSAFQLRDPQGMTFGPSGDTTDDPAELSLYIADRGEPTGAPEARGFAETGKIVELTLLAPRALRPSFATAPLEPAVAVRTIATSAFSPPSPDPSGIAYLPHVGTLLISDGEVNEMPIFVGVNLFEMTPAGLLVSTSVTLPHSDEPVGLTYNPSNGHLFSSDDTGTRSVYEWDPGADGLYGTSDDLVTSFATAPFGSSDPEGVTYDVSQGVLFVVDGVNAEVYRIAPGPNGLFDGGDDVVTHFDTQGFGLTDPEGIAWDSDYGHLYIVGRPNTEVFHVATDGTLLRRIGISAANAGKPAGLEYAPSSANPSVMSLWIVDRGVDNNTDPRENDGKLYEVTLPPFSGNALPRVTITAPASGTLLDLGAPVTFTATAMDPEAGDLTASIGWSSSRDGGLGTGGSVTTSGLSLGTHTITASVTDADGLQASAAIAVTVRIEGLVNLAVRVAASSDDAEETATGGMRLASDLELVADGSRGNQTVGLRFNGVGIPHGATILSASIQFQSDEASSEATSLTFQGEAVDNAPTFTTLTANISSRSRTQSAVTWAPPPWTSAGQAGPDQETPDLAAIVQDIVDRPGWSSGNSLVIIITGTGRRTAEAFDAVPTAAALLRVGYLEQTNTPPTVTIAAPTIGSTHVQGEPIAFSGAATDPEDGDLTASLTWESDLDGPLGMGGSFSRADLTVGVHTVTATAIDSEGGTTSASVSMAVLESGTAVFVGAGDIADCSAGGEATAQLLDGIPGAVYTVGDNAYPNGSTSAFTNCYQPTWGRHKGRTRPAVGDNEYNTSGAGPYYAYFGAAAGDPSKGYYSYDVGSWHIIVLNSNCSQVGGCEPTSLQGQWLAADLAANPRTCTLAIFHEPAFSSSGGNAGLQDLWAPLYSAGADVVLNGHRHNYERFARQNPAGGADPARGLRQFVVGTGGAGHSSWGPTVAPNSEIRDNATYGVLKLTLRPTSYDWAFVPAAGGTFTDSGTENCLVAPPNSAPTANGVMLTGSAVVGQVLTGDYVYGDADFDREGTSTYRWLRNGAPISGATATTYTLVEVDLNASIAFEVTPVAATGASPGTPVQSAALGPVAPAPANVAPVVSDVTITGTPQVGQALSGGYTYSDTDGDLEGASTYRWLRNGVAISGATATGYTLVVEDQGTSIIFEVTPVAATGASPGTPVQSAAVGPVAAANTAPSASGVTIAGTPQVGQVLSGSYTYADVDGDLEGASTYRWLRNGTPINAATATSYSLVAADLGTSIVFEVTPVAATGASPGAPVQSAAVGPVTANTAPAASGVSISGTPEVGQLLSGSYTYADVDGDLEGASTYRWLRNGIPINAATATSYGLVASDQGALITFEVTPVAVTGASPGTPVQSAAVGPVAGSSQVSTVEVRVASGTDDAEQRASGSMYLGSSDLELVNDGGDQTVGMRFNGVAIPAGATITNAHVQFTVDQASSEATSLTVQGQATDNALTFGATSGDISSRTRTASAVAWSPAPWAAAGQAGADQRTPNLATVIQEIVNRPGWASGNSLVIIVTGTGRRVAEAYEGVPTAAPLLHLEYSGGSGGGGTNTAPTASAVIITGSPIVGQLLTGSYAYADANGDPEGASTYRWLRNGAPISGATATSYTLVAADQGATIRFEVTPAAATGASPGAPVQSAPVGPVTAANTAPTASGVTIAGTPAVGQVLNGSYTYSDVDGDAQGVSTYRWLRNGVAIGAATATSYTLVAADQGALITFEVTPVAATGASPGAPVQSAAVGPVAGSSQSSTIGVRVTAGTDDAEERASGSMYLGSSDLELVFDHDNQTVGMRFNGVAIPAGATITSASVQFTVDKASSEATSLTLQGQAADNAVTFGGATGDISARPRTTSTVAWSPVPWVAAGQAGPDQQTPNLAAIIQEIVNRPGWTSGNSLVIIVTGTGQRIAEAFEGVPTAAPLLQVTFVP